MFLTSATKHDDAMRHSVSDELQDIGEFRAGNAFRMDTAEALPAWA
jgi:hypothetical protein